MTSIENLVDPVDLTRALIRIDSVNSSLVPGAGGETEIADFVSNWLSSRGFECHRLEATKGRPSIVAIAKGSGGGSTIMLNGHIDTVSLASYENETGLVDTVKDGNIYGRGSYDMKSGVAAMMVAAAKIADEGHNGDIMLALVADEEFASMGTEEVIKNGFTADGAIIVEPSGLDITIAHRGFVWFEVDIIGQAAHGSRPELGIDAIVKAGKFLTKLGERGEALLAGAKHPLLNTGSMHASLIKGGEELSSYPALCTISVERRTIPGENAQTCEQELREILESIAKDDPDFKFEIRTLFQRTTFAVDPKDRIVTTLANKFKEKTGRDATQRGEPFWTDCALLQDAGIPSVLFGVDGAGAHAAVEWTTIESLEIVTEVLENTIREFVN